MQSHIGIHEKAGNSHNSMLSFCCMVIYVYICLSKLTPMSCKYHKAIFGDIYNLYISLICKKTINNQGYLLEYFVVWK